MIAAIAVVTANIDKILVFAGKWLLPYLTPRTELVIALDPAEQGRIIHVYAAEPGTKPPKIIAVGEASVREPAKFTLPAGTLYDIGWQGTRIRPEVSTGVLVVKGSSFRLVNAGKVDDQSKLELRWSESDKPAPASREPTAGLLIAASATQASAEASTPVAVSILPEVDRAIMIVGMFETGTTDCTRRVYAALHHVTVGCLWFSVPGALASVVISLDAGDARKLDTLVGPDAALVRGYTQDQSGVADDDELKKAFEHLVALPEFWIAYDQRALDYYEQAAVTARQIGLTSERGRLLIFDRLINAPGQVVRAVRSYAEQYPEGAANRPATEPERIHTLADMLKVQVGGRSRPGIVRRIDTIASGHGSINGINFDLDALGISDAG
jgi:hypothetical protein